MEVLDQGPPAPPDGRGARPLLRGMALAAVALGLLAATAVAGARWWAEQEARPERLEVMSLEVTDRVGVRLLDGDSGWPGGLGTPDGAVSPAARLRLTVAGDPQRDEPLLPAPAGPAVVVVSVDGEGARDVGGDAATVPAAGEATVDMVVSPADCSAADGRPANVLTDGAGRDVPMSEGARATLDAAMRDICAQAGAIPVLDVRGALVDVFFRDRTLVLTAALDSTADRVILTPLDGTALRGLGAQDVSAPRGNVPVRLRWLISPGEMSPHTSLTARVQAYVVSDGVAYPWVLTVQPPRNLDAPRPLTPLRNDGVDLAEVAPGPALNRADVQTR